MQRLGGPVSFVKKTRRGGIVKVVGEVYLRDDVSCGRVCTRCTAPATEEEEESDATAVSASSAGAAAGNLEAGDRPILIVDTNVALHQFDALAALRNVVIPQTVVSELQARSQQLWQRLRMLLRQPDRHFYLYANENARETHVEREPGESANDRNDRAVRRAAQWYATHAAPQKVVFLTEDRASLALAHAAHLPAETFVGYVTREHPSAKDLIRFSDREASEAVPSEFAYKHGPYTDHLSDEDGVAGIKRGMLLRGVVRIASHNVLFGTVMTSPSADAPLSARTEVLLIGRRALNRAMEGDVVAVRLLPRRMWRAAPAVIDMDDARDETEEATEDKSEDTAGGSVAEDAANASTTPCGRVVCILSHAWKQYCGTVQEMSDAKSGECLFRCSDARVPRVRLRIADTASLRGKLIVIGVDGWSRTALYPHGHYIRTLGAVGEHGPESDALLVQYDVPTHDFSPAVLACLPTPNERELTPEVIASRLDLRGAEIFSIDPPGCTDIDDALHCRAVGNGLWEVGVHIADVSHYVKPYTALDDEAALRCTTVYLVNRRIEMLPSLLSSDLCSLRSNVDRLAFSIIWRMNSAGEIQGEPSFHKSIIRSIHSFTYAQAQERMDDLSRSDSVTLAIRQLNTLAVALKAGRVARGALTLASPEVKFLKGEESEDPIDVELYEHKATNSLVEEFMLLANVAAAQAIYQSFPSYALLRRHPAPDPKRFVPLQKAVGRLGYLLDVGTSLSLAQSLDRIEVASDSYVNRLVRILATRCMNQATYFCSSSVRSQADFHHYGLASPIYTHFTSPIRRYADVIVHRLLAATIGEPMPPLDKAKVVKIADTINRRHRMAQSAQRSCVELYTVFYFRGKSALTEEAYVTRLKTNGIIVLVPRYGIEGAVLLPTHFQLDDEAQEIRPTAEAPPGSLVYRVFDRVIVRVSLHQPKHTHKPELIFALATEAEKAELKTKSKDGKKESSKFPATEATKKKEKRAEPEPEAAPKQQHAGSGKPKGPVASEAQQHSNKKSKGEKKTGGTPDAKRKHEG